MANNTSTQKLVNELEKAVDTSKKLLKAFEGTQEVTKDLAKDLENAFKGVDKKTSKGIAELNKLLEKTNKLTEESEKITKAKDETEKDLIKTEKKLAAARLSEIKEKQQLQKLDSLKQKTAVAVAKEEERLLALKEKQQKATKRTQDAYQKESSLLRKMKNELKATVIEMRRLGKSEDEVAKATDELGKEINKLDRELRDLDKSVGDSFREIGKYEEALESLSSTANTVKGALVGVGTELVAGLIVESIAANRAAQLELDKLQNKAKAGAAVLGSSVLDVFSTTEVEAAFKAYKDATVETATISRNLKLANLNPFSDEEDIKNLEKQLELAKEFALVKLKESKATQKIAQETKESQNNGGSVLDTIDALDNLSSKTLDVEIANKDLTRQLSEQVEEQQRLIAISDDATRSFDETIDTKIQLTKQNKIVAETQNEIAKNEIEIQNLNVGAELLAKNRISVNEALNLTTEQANVLLKDKTNLLSLAEGTDDAYTQAYVRFVEARTEATQIALETEEKLSQLYSDKIERDLDILIDGADKIKSINEQIIADESISNDKKRFLLEDTKEILLDSYKAQIDSISDFAKKRIELNSQISETEKKQLKDKVKVSDIESLIAIKDAKELNERIRLLGLSEIFEGRTLEVVREKLQVMRDLEETQKDLNATIAKTAEINEDILDQEKLLKVLNDESIKTRKQLDEAIKQLDDDRVQNRIDAINKELEIVGDNSKLEAELNQEKNDLLIQQDQEAADDRIEIEEKRVDRSKDIADDYLAWVKKGREEDAEKQKKLLENSIQVFDSVLSKAREKQNEETDKELDVLDTRIDTVRTAIENGNEGASDSLAELEKQKIEAEQKKEEIRKKEIRDEMLIAGLQAFASNDGNVGKTLGDVSLLIAALNTLPSFFDGTEDTGTVQKPLDSNGGRTAILHDNERVMTAKQNAKLGGISNEDLADLGAMHNSGNLKGGTTIIEANNKELIAEVKEMTKAVRSIPIQSYNYDSKGKYHEQVIQSNNKKETIKVRVNNLFK